MHSSRLGLQTIDFTRRYHSIQSAGTHSILPRRHPVKRAVTRGRDALMAPSAVLTTRANGAHVKQKEISWNSTPNSELEGHSSPQPDIMHPKLLPVQFLDGSVKADGGFSILDGIGSSITASAAPGMEGALLLGASVDRAASSIDTILGTLRCKRFLACARIKLWWMTPEWGSKAEQLPPETQFVLLQLSREGPYAVLLPLIDSGKFRCTLRPPRKGEDPASSLRMRIESGDGEVSSSTWKSAVLVAAGYDPYHLVDLAVAQASQLSGGAKARADKVVPEFINHFGWCTWDAFYSTVSAEGLQQGLKSLQEGKVPPGFLIIDDGWQQTQADDFKAEKNVVRLEAKKQMLKSVGAGGHYPVDKLDAGEGGPQGKKSSWLADLAESSIGRLQALAETVLFKVYKNYIENAPEGSWRISAFKVLTQGPLKSHLLNYYALTSDHTRRLQGVQANGKFSSTAATSETPIASKEDLRAIVKNAKEDYGVKYVYAWHSLHGYWAGIATGNSAAMPYNAQLIMPQPTPGVLEIDPCFAWAQQVLSGVGVAEDVKELYKDMHTYLAGAGIDGVKVDCQAILGMVGGGSPGLGGGPAMSAEYHSALEASVATHFPGNNCINCMCHSTEDIYRMESTTVARSSDDFWPQDPASHTTHVAVNAYNSLFMGALLQPDWDMFHSRHPAALLHATARVVSGGPIYVSDKPGQHDIQLLKRLVLSDGTLLRCQHIGRPTVDCLFDDVMRDGTSVLKVWNMNTSNAVVAAFNLQGAAWSRQLRKYDIHDTKPTSLSVTVSPGDVPTFKDKAQGRRYVVYSDRLRKTWQVSSWEGVHVELSGGESDIFTLAPMHEAAGCCFAPIGLVNMLNSGGAISSLDAPGDDKAGFTFEVRGSGKLLAFCSQAPTEVTANGRSINFEHSKADNTVSFTLAEEHSNVAVHI